MDMLHRLHRLFGMALVLFVGLATATPALAAAVDAGNPLDYPLKQYGFMLGTALFGGLVSWVAKVRKGDAKAWNIMQMVGELATSAFAGLLCFWICEAAGMALAWTVPLVGIAGHMGTRAIGAFEEFAEKKWGAIS